MRIRVSLRHIVNVRRAQIPARSLTSGMELTVSRGLQAGLSQHFLGLFQREFRVIPHDNRQQLGSHLREAELLRRPAFIVFTVRLHGREVRTTRRRMPSDRASMVNPAPAPPAYAKKRAVPDREC